MKYSTGWHKASRAIMPLLDIKVKKIKLKLKTIKIIKQIKYYLKNNPKNTKF